MALEARHPHQVRIGDELGAGHPSGEYDVVIEATSTESGLHRSFALARPRGTVVCIGVYPSEITWPYRTAFLKEVRMIPSMSYERVDGVSEVARAVTLLAAHPAVVDRLITHRFGIDEAPRAFEVAADRSSGAFRVVVHP